MMNTNTPQWFKDSIANNPEICSVKVKGTKIVYNTWGDKENPGLIFVHGGMAHAEWWNFIGPYFARTHRVCLLYTSDAADE